MAIERRTLEVYHDHDVGLPYPIIVRNAAIEEFDAATGESLAVGLPHPREYVKAVALVRALHPLQLAGAEIRFMRKVLGMQAKDFAAAIPIRPETFSRIEHDHEPTSDYVDQLIRHYVCAELFEEVAGIDFNPRAITHMRRIRRSKDTEEPQIELKLVPATRSESAGRTDWARAA
jgi:DNA-binding transcriptional regulator YiaG